MLNSEVSVLAWSPLSPDLKTTGAALIGFINGVFHPSIHLCFVLSQGLVLKKGAPWSWILRPLMLKDLYCSVSY